jgi:1-phosphatidylinositol-4-phosphate 5-kinase
LRSGRGIYVAPSGSRYEGEWKNNFPNGKGELLTEKGERIFGQWYKGNIGSGVYTVTFPEKNGRYVGNVDQSFLPNGFGTQIWPDGTKYSGNWKAGYQHGYGILTDASGNVQYEGTWIEGLPLDAEPVELPSDALSK